MLDDHIDVMGMDNDVLGQAILTYSHEVQEVLFENFAGLYGRHFLLVKNEEKGMGHKGYC